jgi:hypothetical protein
VNSVECNFNANNIDFEDGIIRIGSEFNIAEEKIVYVCIRHLFQKLSRRYFKKEQAVYNIICILFSD